ncbi:histidine kinase/DNA gyrase B/HSP90-like ATPase [Phytobacter diazotrophicus]|nr:histidine kinase/DNA gyrase B/HSP90-like ATPase [Phytobacter diazotrophicus]
MTREEALVALTSENSHTKFKAVRELESLALETDIQELLQIKASESDTYLIRGIERLIQNLHSDNYVEDTEPDVIPQEVKKKLRAEAIEWVAGLLLHEIGSKIGLLASTISNELPNYAISRTKTRIEHLQDVFDGIGELKKATSLPHPIDMDLPTFLKDIVELEMTDKDIDVSFVGRSPLVIFCDRGLLRLALCNGIKNALEAAISLSNEERRASIVISWGQTDRDTWISVIDNGPGLPGNSASSFNLGETSKSGHLGFGLGIASQAIETLHGKVELRNSESEGAVFELRWSLKP